MVFYFLLQTLQYLIHTLISLTEKIVCACVYVVSYKERFRNKIFDGKQKHVS